MTGLSDYISEATKKGFEKEEIIELLLKKGYSEKEINNAFNSMQKKTFAIKYTDETVPYLEKIKLLFSKPKNFFEIIRENNIGQSIILFLIVSAIISALSFGISMLFSGIFMYSALSMIGIGLSGGFYLIALVIGFGLSFIFAGISHLLVKLFKGTGNYLDTYNVVIYSVIPAIILGLVPLLGFLSFIYSIVLMTFGFSAYHNISKGKAVASALLPILLLIILIICLFLFLLSNSRIF